MIFKNNARRFFDVGIPVIPCNGKIPAVRNFPIWSEREQTEDELEDMIERYPACNIAVVLGLNLSGIDVDTDDEKVLRACQYSPVMRRGQKGTYNFFKPSKENSQLPNGVPVEFHSRGRIVVVPPSIHPVTKKPYQWIGEEDLVNGLDELDEFDPAQFEKLKQLCHKYELTRGNRDYSKRSDGVALLTDTGRNNRLTGMAYAMACDGETIESGWERLFDFDKSEHEPAWFSDPTEPHRGRHPEQNAKKMLARAIAKATKRGDRIEGASEPLHLQLDTVVKTIDTPPNRDLYPSPRGFIKIFVDYCNELSRGSQDILALGGAVTLMGALCSNKFYSRVGGFDIWPNLFTINLAYSGFGKETCQRVISELLMDSPLLGSGNYKSGTAIVQSLPKQQERLDVIDECSALLRAMGGKEDYKSEIVEILSSLYTKSSSFFHGQSSRVDGQNFGSCWNPCVNILGSTTPTGFRNAVRADLASKGLLPRFLLFYQNDPGEFKREMNPERTDVLRAQCQKFVNKMLRVGKFPHPDWERNLLKTEEEDPPRWQPQEIHWTRKAQLDWLDMYQEHFEEAKKDPESYGSAFRNRFAQHVAKVALIDTISQGLEEVSVASFEWARKLVDGQWRASAELYELVSAESDWEKNYLKLRNFVHKNGKVNHSRLLRNSKISSHDFKKIIQTMVERDEISAERYERNGRAGIMYHANYDHTKKTILFKSP